MQRDRLALHGLAAALGWLSVPERGDRLRRARARAARLTDAALSAGFAVHGSLDPDLRLPTVGRTSRRQSPGELSARLAERGVVAAGGLQCAPLAHETLGTAPHGVLRPSVGVQTDDEDVERGIGALRHEG